MFVDLNGLPLGPEAQQLLAALEKFVTTLVCPKVVKEDEITNMEAYRKGRLTSDAGSKMTGDSEKNKGDPPPLLKAALDKMRYRVFNQMPIRMLAFKSDGTEMELIERNTIWDRISSAMKSDFDEGKVKADISLRSRTRTHNGPPAQDAVMEAFVSRHAEYAILSHTWLPGTAEVTYADWNIGRFDKTSAGYLKLSNFCKTAATDYKLMLGWMDTICINKDSSTELDESIRSMFKWYRDAAVCVTYLAQTTAIQRMHADPWFTRGWTLQELMAPLRIKFYDANWQKLGPVELEDDKAHYLIQGQIQTASTITSDEFSMFQNTSSRDQIPLSRRMQWASERDVTREEDSAYSLMGIVDVSISIAYGEGAEKAFFRLVKEIMSISTQNVLDIGNWGIGPTTARPATTSTAPSFRFIPSSPKQYLWRTNSNIPWRPLTTPIILTHLGVQLPILLMPGLSTLVNAPFHPVGRYYATVDIGSGSYSYSDNQELPKKYNVLERGISNSEFGWNRTRTRYQIMLGVLNFDRSETDVFLPSGLRCFAICFSLDQNAVQNRKNSTAASRATRILTSRSIEFQLQGGSEVIQQSELSKHGMRLLTIYL